MNKPILWMGLSLIAVAIILLAITGCASMQHMTKAEIILYWLSLPITIAVFFTLIRGIMK